MTTPNPKILAEAIKRSEADMQLFRGIDDPEIKKLVEFCAVILVAAKAYGLMLPVVEAVQEWASNKEGQPSDPNDADLLKALCTYDGDKTEPCEGCDGDCGEPCAPCTVEQAHRELDRFSDEWRKRHGVVVLPAALNPKDPSHE